MLGMKVREPINQEPDVVVDHLGELRDCFNPRVQHIGGRLYPWWMSKVVEAIRQAHKEGSYSTKVKLDKLEDHTKVQERLR